MLGGPDIVPAPEQGIAVRDGIVDMTSIPSAMYEGLVPGVSMLGTSEITIDEERQRGAYDIIAGMHEKAGLFFLGRGDTRGARSQFAMVLRDKKIETPYDLAGLKYGASSTHIKGFAEVLGMTFVFTRFPDIYTGIERGVFDAFSLPPGTYTALGIEEVVKYMVDHG